MLEWINKKLLRCKVEMDSTVEMVIHQSGILTIFPDIDLTKQKVGVFSKPAIIRQSSRRRSN